MIKLFKKKEDSIIAKILVGVFFVFSLIYVLIVFIKNSFNKPDIYYSSDLPKYTISENLVLNANFYVTDARIANFLEAVDKEMYNQIYEILDGEYSKIYSKNDVKEILTEYKKNIFKYDENIEKKYTGHVINVYQIGVGKYLTQLDFNNNNFYIVISDSLKGYTFSIVE